MCTTCRKWLERFQLSLDLCLRCLSFSFVSVYFVSWLGPRLLYARAYRWDGIDFSDLNYRFELTKYISSFELLFEIVAWILDLGGNSKMTGSLPSEFGKLQSLEYLRICKFWIIQRKTLVVCRFSQCILYSLTISNNFTSFSRYVFISHSRYGHYHGGHTFRDGIVAKIGTRLHILHARVERLDSIRVWLVGTINRARAL